MARTYHDAPLTAEQIDKVLSSMNSVSKASNNGKILCVDDFGFLTAKTQQELHIGAVLEPVTISENGTVTPPEGVDGFDSVTVDVQGSAPVLQNKIVTQNGVVTPDTGYDGLGQVTVDVPGGGYPEPTGTIPITANGTVNVKDYETAQVNVPSGITAADEGKVVKNGVLVTQTARATEITVNGTYDTTENNSVTVNVSGGGGSDDPFALKNYIESSGTQWIDTEYIPKQNSEYEVVATFLNGNPIYSMILGARAVREGTGGNPVIFGPGSVSFQIGWGTRTLTTGISSTPFVGLKGVYDFDKDGYDASTESKRPSGYGAFSGGDPLTTNSLYLFSLNAAGSEYGTNTRCKAKLYRFRIFESGVLVHEFIPWQENGVACLKDTVTSDLLYNAGTGDFVYGTDA